MRAMGGSPIHEPPAELLGRERERTAIDRLLSKARSGDGGALVIRGQAGIGKTALVGLAQGETESMEVLKVTGVEAEADLAFAGLFGLLRPILGFVGELPATHSAALEGSLGVAPSAEPDRLLVSGAVLGLLAAASARRPIVCVVDDAHWLDKPSADALVFAARRLGAERVAMLFAAREDELSRFDAEGVPELLIEALDDQAAARLLTEHVPSATPAVTARLLAEAEGNPLALVELPSVLSEDQLIGRAALPDAMPLTPRLAAVFRTRVERLPPDAQAALLVVAVDGTGELATVLTALAELAVDADGLDPAERAGLIQTDETRVRFRHPLVRAAVYEAAPLGERRRVHAALVTALSGEEHVDRRVWHQAMASIARDEEVAVALEASARRAQLRAGHASAATAFERAAELTVTHGRQAPRLASAARAAWDGGQPQRALDLVGRALPLSDASLRADLLYLRGVIESRCGSVRDAAATLLGQPMTPSRIWRWRSCMRRPRSPGAIGQLKMVRTIGERAARAAGWKSASGVQQAHPRRSGRTSEWGA